MKQDTNLRSAQELIGLDGIRDGLLSTGRKVLFAFIRVQGRDNSLLDGEDNTAATEQLTAVLAKQKEPWQLLAVPRTVDITGTVRDLEALKANAATTMQIRLLDGEIEAMKQLRSDGAKDPLILLKLWRKESPDAAQELLRRAQALSQELGNSGVSARLLEDDEILHLCRTYSSLDAWLPREELPSDIPVLPGRNRRLTKKSDYDGESRRLALLEQVTPVGGFFFDANSLKAGGVCARCYGVTRFPPTVGFGWAVELMNCDSAITCMTYTPGLPGELGDALARSIARDRRDAGSSRNVREQKTLERKSRSADRLLDDLDGKGMAVGHLSVVTMPFAAETERLEAVCREITGRFSGAKLGLRRLTAVQKQAYLHLTPYYPPQEEIQQMLQRIIPLETLMGGYPMTSTVVRDDHGAYFGMTPDDRVITLDIWERSPDRTNGNGIVYGPSGVGKSTTVKSVVQTQFMLGKHIIIFDPEREYRDLCKNLNGSWWAAGGGGARVNLFQVFPIPPDDEQEALFRADPRPVFQHVQRVKTVLRYMQPELTNEELALLEDAIIIMYQNFGITVNMTDGQLRVLPAERFPIMQDLYRMLKDWEGKDIRYGKLALLMRSMAEGADSEIWNGHTNISLDNRLVVIDTKQLQDTTRENQVAQYYNLLSMAHSKAAEDRDTPYFIMADEAQTMLDPELPHAAKSLKDMALRIRKREGCLWLAFHSLHELMDDKVRLEGQAILDSAAYKIIFGTTGQNLVDTVSLFHLSQAERKLLEKQQRGKALCIVGSQHIQTRFLIPQYKLDLMGKGGGR